MAAMTAALIASVMISAASSIHQAQEADQARIDGKTAANEQKAESEKVASDANAASTKANDLSTSNLLRDASKARQQSIIGNSLGRGSTILTGGRGVAQPANTASKTLLGQ